MRYLLPMLFGAMALAPVPAVACEPSLEPGPTSVAFAGISIGAGLSSEESLPVTVRNTGDTPCSLVLRVSRGLASVDFSMPPYLLLGPVGEVEIVPFAETAGTTRGDIAVNVAAQSTRMVPLVFRVPTGWGMRSGHYADQLWLSLVGADGSEVDDRQISLAINIPSAAALRLFGAAGVAGPARIDLGRLSSTQETRSAPFALRIWSTAPYNVSFRSENSGYLVHGNGVDRIPYRLMMDAAEIDLAAARPYYFPDHTSATGDIYPLLVTVQPVRAIAGDYGDRVTVSVTAL